MGVPEEENPRKRTEQIVKGIILKRFPEIKRFEINIEKAQ